MNVDTAIPNNDVIVRDTILLCLASLPNEIRTSPSTLLSAEASLCGLPYMNTSFCVRMNTTIWNWMKSMAQAVYIGQPVCGIASRKEIAETITQWNMMALLDAFFTSHLGRTLIGEHPSKERLNIRLRYESLSTTANGRRRPVSNTLSHIAVNFCIMPFIWLWMLILYNNSRDVAMRRLYINLSPIKLLSA